MTLLIVWMVNHIELVGVVFSLVAAVSIGISIWTIKGMIDIEIENRRIINKVKTLRKEA